MSMKTNCRQRRCRKSCWVKIAEETAVGVMIPLVKRARVCKTEEGDYMLGREDAAYL